MTVPTGGGKTLSSLAFALTHAVLHGLDRVIYAIPYTSIIDQTVDAFRSVLGSDEAVLAHHSAAFEPTDEADADDGPDWRRLAAENWDSPVVVTTNVQFFESLLASRPGRCRKVHRIARSVVVLDEVQTLPPRLLEPLLDIIARLASDWGTTFVLCSATQPAVGRHDKPGVFLPNLRDIVADPRRLFQVVRRVDYEVPEEPWSWARLAAEVRTHEQCLVILNTRKDALAVLDILAEGLPDVLHISTLLTPAHRRRVLETIRARLRAGEPCRVVSTQVVEAGVDIDFPVVMRAVGPLDSVIQAAGRCNREGRLAAGRVIVFEPSEGTLPPKEYRTGAELARFALRQGVEKLYDPDTSTEYFADLYANVELDALHLQRRRSQLLFREVDEHFHLIAEDSVPVIIPSEVTDPVINELDHDRSLSPSLWARLQQHSVALRLHDLHRVDREGLVRQAGVRAGVYVWQGRYDDVRGLGGFADDAGRLVV
ncbi:MAG: CRISPR-associated helicase Cas3' [Coriobacteriia bacterium]|nr:CRISPR-associated helicase Cas3' [Coriobacteriia bacterium]